MLSESQKYHILSTRDESFIGVFIAAIKTTGIYCRPGCPARTPKPQNCEYFETFTAARQAGYRACKRLTQKKYGVNEMSRLKGGITQPYGVIFNLVLG